MLGAQIITTVGSDAKESIVKALGVQHVLRYKDESQEKLVEKVKAWTQGRGVNVVYDGVGAATFDFSLKCLVKQGYMISFGNASGKVPPFEIAKLSHGNIYLARPSLFEYLDSKGALQSYSTQLFEFMRNHAIYPTLHKIYPFPQVQEAHHELESRKSTGKILISFIA